MCVFVEQLCQGWAASYVSDFFLCPLRVNLDLPAHLEYLEWLWVLHLAIGFTYAIFWLQIAG